MPSKSKSVKAPEDKFVKEINLLIDLLNSDEFKTYESVWKKCQSIRAKVPQDKRGCLSTIGKIEKAVKAALNAEVNEICRMWKDDEYDNFKDLILDCRDILKDLPEIMTPQRKKIKKLLSAAAKEMNDFQKADPSMKKYLKSLIPMAVKLAE